MSFGKAPRLLIAGAFFLGLALPVPDANAEVKKSKAKTQRQVRKAPPRQPAWGSMPPARPLALKNFPARSLTRSEALERHRDGLAAERAGDDQRALMAFHEAAEAGHGPALVKLGEIYDRGNSVVERDYVTALSWYQRAREQGVAVPKPHTFPAGR
jgi:TPR repeat protein